MTIEEKAAIACFQLQGHGYKKIAQLTGLPLNTVKSYCRRNPVVVSGNICKQCGKPVVQPPHTREKRFCSDRCRMLWWNSHPEQVRRKTVEHCCARCGVSFQTHIPSQQFCSRACYADARRKAVQCDG